MSIQSGTVFADRADVGGLRFAASRRPRSSGRTSAIERGLLHARRATGLTGTESGGSLDRTESVARWSRQRCRTYDADSSQLGSDFPSAKQWDSNLTTDHPGGYQKTKFVLTAFPKFRTTSVLLLLSSHIIYFEVHTYEAWPIRPIL